MVLHLLYSLVFMCPDGYLAIIVRLVKEAHNRPRIGHPAGGYLLDRPRTAIRLQRTVSEVASLTVLGLAVKTCCSGWTSLLIRFLSVSLGYLDQSKVQGLGDLIVLVGLDVFL